MENEIAHLELMISHLGKLNTKISIQGVEWHIDHSLKVIIGSCKAIKKSNPSDYKKTTNLARKYVFTTNSFPRGLGKAPKSTVAQGPVLEKDILYQLKQAKQQLDDIDSLPERSNFNHPYFGLLDLNQTKKFLKIHTNHHLKIIRDIIKD